MADSTVAAPAARTATLQPDRFNAFITACEWLFILAALGLWMAFKTYHPFMNAGIGLWFGTWAARWLRDGRFTRPTPLDLPMLGFGASVVIGYVVAPHPADALARLFLFAGAIGLYYVLVNSSARAVAVFGFGYMMAAGAFGVYFASQHPWAEQPGKFDFFQPIGLWLNQAVPNLNQYQPHPNVVGGVVGLGLLMCLVAGAHYAAQLRALTWARRGWLAALVLAGAVLAFGLAMTQSRAMWGAAALGLAVGGWFWLSGRAARALRLSHWAVFAACMFAAGAALASVLAARMDLLNALLGSLPGPNSALTRVEIFSQVWRLAQDTPFTGAGLASFPGLYSLFVLSVPPLFLTHAHNNFLNLFVEQGWLGGATFGLIVLASIWHGSRRAAAAQGDSRAWVIAGLVGAIAFAVQGIGDGTLVASRAVPAVFIPAALALAGGPPDEHAWKPAPWMLAPLAMLVVGAFLVAGRSTAQWHANWGALEHNRVALIGWPNNQWDDGSRVGLLAQAQAHFNRALDYDPHNQTALYRSGMIAMLRQDFGMATRQLQQAYQGDAEQRVVIKNLGYGYVWMGNFEAAAPLLARVPEARSELEVYRWWWANIQNRNDLAGQADVMLGRMQ